jgi:hypothetical protein
MTIPGDAFSVDVLNDPVSKPPYSKENPASRRARCGKGDDISCRTNRFLEPIAGYPLQAINIPSKEAAIFRFN